MKTKKHSRVHIPPDLTPFLIREELKSRKFFGGLQKLGLDYCFYQPHLDRSILAAVELDEESDEVFDFYFTGSDELKPLLNNTDLKEIPIIQHFDTGEFHGKGAFGLGNDSQKIDYLLLSPALFDRVTACGLFRKGAWPGKSPKRWTVYDELEKEIHVTSDHHVVWCEVGEKAEMGSGVAGITGH